MIRWQTRPSPEPADCQSPPSCPGWPSKDRGTSAPNPHPTFWQWHNARAQGEEAACDTRATHEVFMPRVWKGLDTHGNTPHHTNHTTTQNALAKCFQHEAGGVLNFLVCVLDEFTHSWEHHRVVPGAMTRQNQQRKPQQVTHSRA